MWAVISSLNKFSMLYDWFCCLSDVVCPWFHIPVYCQLVWLIFNAQIFPGSILVVNFSYWQYFIFIILIKLFKPVLLCIAFVVSCSVLFIYRLYIRYKPLTSRRIFWHFFYYVYNNFFHLMYCIYLITVCICSSQRILFAVFVYPFCIIAFRIILLLQCCHQFFSTFQKPVLAESGSSYYLLASATENLCRSEQLLLHYFVFSSCKTVVVGA